MSAGWKLHLLYPKQSCSLTGTLVVWGPKASVYTAIQQTVCQMILRSFRRMLIQYSEYLISSFVGIFLIFLHTTNQTRSSKPEMYGPDKKEPFFFFSAFVSVTTSLTWCALITEVQTLSTP